MMKTKTCYTLLILALVLSGCAVVSSNRVFPKLSFYWSKDAQAQRQERREAETYGSCRNDLNTTLNLRREKIVDLASAGKTLVDKYGASLVANVIVNEWQAETTNGNWQTQACNVMWVQDQTPREQDLSWLLCFHSEWDGSAKAP